MNNSEWIKVEHELPRHGEKVLAYEVGYEHIHFVTFFHYKRRKYPEWDGDTYTATDITHWMRLPKKP